MATWYFAPNTTRIPHAHSWTWALCSFNSPPSRNLNLSSASQLRDGGTRTPSRRAPQGEPRSVGCHQHGIQRTVPQPGLPLPDQLFAGCGLEGGERSWCRVPWCPPSPWPFPQGSALLVCSVRRSDRDTVLAVVGGRLHPCARPSPHDSFCCPQVWEAFVPIAPPPLPAGQAQLPKALRFVCGI